jgi:proteasome component ECM29
VLPVKALLEQYKSTDSAPIKQFDLSFIQHSLERIDDDDRRNLIPLALRGCYADEGQPRAGPFFRIVLRLLLDIRIPPRGTKDDDTFNNTIGLSDSQDAQYISEMIALFLRLRAPAAETVEAWREANPTFVERELEIFRVENAGSLKIFARLSELKAKLVALLASGAFTDQEKFLPTLFAASSFDNRVASAAEEVLKRSSVSMEDEALARRLFEAHSKLPAAYRIRILGMLSKSSISTTMSDQILAVVNLDLEPRGSGSSLQPSSVLEQSKLHTALFHYLAWVARVGPSRDGFTIAPELIGIMRRYIEAQGWPVARTTNSTDNVALRSKAYEMIGMLSRNVELPTPDLLDLAEWLFTSLSQDPLNDTVVNIDGALSSLALRVPASLEQEHQLRLQRMLVGYMELGDMAPAVRSTRHAVVKWANQCLPFSNLYARWIDILAIGVPNERNDVIEQGHKGLDPWTYLAHNESDLALPDWTEMAAVYFDILITPDSVGISGSESPSYPLEVSTRRALQNFTGNRVTGFAVALRYIKRLMFLSALDDFKIQSHWMQMLDARVDFDVASRRSIRNYLRSAPENSLSFYLKVCLSGAILEDSPITEECLRCFVDVASLCPAHSTGYLAHMSFDLLPLVKSNNKAVRSLSARALGILGAHPAHDDGNLEKLKSTLEAHFQGAEKLVGADLNAAEGGLLAYGYHCSRMVLYDDNVTPKELRAPFGFLVEENTPPSLLETALESFSQLWSVGLALPPMEGDHSINKVVGKLRRHAKKGDEKAIQALGRLAVGLNEQDPGEDASGKSEVLFQGVIGTILKELFALHEIKRVEIHFTVGDAISAAAARWDSDSVKLTLDVESRPDQKQAGSRKALTTAVLDKLIADCKTTKPSLLKASGIWLFCVVQYCSHLPEVQSRLREAQAAFMRLLSARDELVQETASRGLSLVYERGDAGLKSTLVKDLVSAFTGSSTQLKVDEDTELFGKLGHVLQRHR